MASGRVRWRVWVTNEGTPLYGVPSVRDGALMHRRGKTTREAEVRHNPDSLKRGVIIMGLIEGASTLVLVYRRFS